MEAGTNPRDPSSRFQTMRAELDADGYRIEFETLPDREYKVQFRDALAVGEWLDLTDYFTEVGDSVTVYDSDSKLHLQRFYRAVVRLPL